MIRISHKFTKLIITLIISYVFICYFLHSIDKLLKTNNIPKNQIQKLSLEKSKEFYDNGRNYVTVVAMYFKLNQSKYNTSVYDKWIRNFLKSVSSPIVLFTDPNSENMILKARGNLPIHLNIYKDIWAVMNLLEIERNRNYTNNYKIYQYQIDPENYRHNPDLYAIWNLKTFMTYYASKENIFNSNFFIYADAGGWREDDLIHDWPNIYAVKQINSILFDRILFSQIDKTVRNIYSPSSDIIEGGFFAGSKKAIQTFYNLFYDLHDKLWDKGWFIGKDQRMMNILTFDKAKKLIVRIRTWGFKCTKNYDPWFFFIYYFANKQDYNCNQERIQLLIFNYEERTVNKNSYNQLI